MDDRPEDIVPADTLSQPKSTLDPYSPPRWTVMVFMGADVIPGNADLLPEAMNSIGEMERVIASMPGFNRSTPEKASLNIFVQLHAEGVIKRAHVGVDGLRPVNLATEDATNGNALTSLIKWAIRANQHRRNDYSILVMWGHSYLFGVGPQTLRNGIDALDFAELSDVLQRFQNEEKREFGEYYPGDDLPKLDIVGFDACDLATVEMACQLAPFADYLLASQIGIPLPGWPYEKILGRLAAPKGDLMGPAELGSYAARRFCETYAADDPRRPVTMSMLDLKQADALGDLTETLARKLAIALAEDDAEMNRVYELFVQSRTPDGRPFVDVADLCVNLMRNSQYDDVREAARAVGDLLIGPHPERKPERNERGSAQGVKKAFIVENCRNSAETAGMNGVSLYAPHVSDNDFEKALHFYEKFLFAKKTLWSDLVHGLALPA
jgi:cysteine peptidase C11 family protein